MGLVLSELDAGVDEQRLQVKPFSCKEARIVLTPTRVSNRGVQKNQVHTINLVAQEVPNLDFEPIPM